MEYARTLPQVDPEKILVGGHSLGALAAAEYIKNKQNGLYSMKELLMDSAVGMK